MYVYLVNSNTTFLTNYRKAVDQGLLLFHSLCQSPSWERLVKAGLEGEGEQEAPVRPGYNCAMKPGCQDSAGEAQRPNCQPHCTWPQGHFLGEAFNPLGQEATQVLSILCTQTSVRVTTVSRRQQMP